MTRRGSPAFPYGYRHLGYVQEAQGQRVLRGLPGLRGPEVELLYEEGAAWLAGLCDPRRAARRYGVIGGSEAARSGAGLRRIDHSAAF